MMAPQLLDIPQTHTSSTQYQQYIPDRKKNINNMSSTQYQQLGTETHAQKCFEMQNEIINLNFLWTKAF